MTTDPISLAEQVVGESIRHPLTQIVAMDIATKIGDSLEAAFREGQDTYLGMPYSDALNVADRLGFEEPTVFPFGLEEHYTVIPHRDGLLLAIETYRGTRVARMSLYYNWLPRGTSPVRSVDLSITGGMIAMIGLLSRNGRFLSPWVSRPFVHLTHRNDTTDPVARAMLTALRVVSLPHWAKEMITPGR